MISSTAFSAMKATATKTKTKVHQKPTLAKPLPQQPTFGEKSQRLFGRRGWGGREREREEDVVKGCSFGSTSAGRKKIKGIQGWLSEVSERRDGVLALYGSDGMCMYICIDTHIYTTQPLQTQTQTDKSTRASRINLQIPWLNF